MSVMDERGVSTVPQATQPRTWSFIDRRTGKPMAITCLQDCTLDHTSDMATPTFPEDIWCWTAPEALTLPINANGTPEEFRVLATVIKVEPYSPTIAQRLPYATIELVDDHFIEGLDPDGLETVINTLASRLDQMRETHVKLARIREEYRTR